MRNLTVFLIAVLAAGCASVSATATPTLNPSPASLGNQEEQIRRTLVGTWNGYIKDTPLTRVGYNTPTLKIFWVEKTPEGKWSIALSLNGKRIDVAELTVNNTMVMVEFIEFYANIAIHHSLFLYGERRMVGKIWYGTRSFGPAEVIFNKIN